MTDSRRTIVHVFLSPIQHESRLVKEARSILAANIVHHICVFGIWRKGLSELETLEPGLIVRRIHLRSGNWPNWLIFQAFKYLEWSLKIVRRIGKEIPIVVHAHSLAALPVAVLAKLMHGFPIVYDAHELETERTGLRGIRRWLARTTECLLIRRADEIMVVSDGIADWYSRVYRIPRPHVVRNVPLAAMSNRNTSELREKCGIGKSEILFLYLGVIGPGRSIERLCRVFSRASSGRHLVFLGYGALEGLVHDFSREYPNIHFVEAVPPSEVASNLRSADVGICLIENVSMSYWLSLPNKLFQCLAEAVPVMINDLPEQVRFVKDFQCGWIVPPTDESLLQLIDSIGRKDIEVYKNGALQAAETLNWDDEIVPYVDFCRRGIVS
ncbi:glycoside hydrolase [Steroidobacter denitrificans]|uniref:Glycoside hydrolase n=2 Tax=Steroidobacter denitrificans TaxID=465721 RepID=A0A127FA16_STEDE|nr:glycoside hydrolase [Steroidobacter denitrificans]